MPRRGVDVTQVGQAGTFTRTVTDAEVTQFAAVSGDDNALHVDEAFARATRFGARIAHGALLVGYISAAFTDWWRRHAEGQTDQLAISYGYDRIRFIRPTLLGDTITAEHRIAEVVPEEDKALADATCTNQRGELVVAARHVVKFV
jgi:3-hydroxybutyryl-CoA dehydratase